MVQRFYDFIIEKQIKLLMTMISSKKFMSLVVVLLCSLGLSAQMANPVDFKYKFRRISDTEAVISFDCDIDDGWHVYSTDLPEGGPVSTTFNIDKSEGVELDGPLMHGDGEIEHFDSVFEMDLKFFEKKAHFEQKLKITGKKFFIEGYLEYGACDNSSCMPPTAVNFKFEGKGAAGGLAPKAEETVEEEAAAPAEVAPSEAEFGNSDLWTPVVKELKDYGDENASTEGRSWLYIFFAGILGGFIALFTPCVWPIIPMTVSFFLKRADKKSKGVRDAVTYGISIIVIYVSLGILITLIFGDNALNALSTNAGFNIFLFLLLVVFAASFFGGFEIALPSKWNNAVDDKAEESSGFLSIFLMAFTLTLVSFSCTGPIIGLLLAGLSTSGDMMAPIIGMLGFAIALALPFTLFALFPTWLKSMPKSGGWMNTVKVVLGFIELAFALKFLSVADLAYGWHILDRETFLALWIMIFALLGMYLLGKLKFPYDSPSEHTSIPRFFMGLVTLSFALYMVPGLWGAPLKAVSAFAPPMYTQDFNLNQNVVHAKFDDYEKGMKYAKEHGKPVMLDFTGYGCVNCRKMEAAVWTDAKVYDMMTNDYVLITLYVDNKDKLPEPIIVEDGRKLRTVGDKWSYLQRKKFGALSQPFYVLVDNEGMPLNKSYAFDENVSDYVKFLRTGLKNYKKR